MVGPADDEQDIRAAQERPDRFAPLYDRYHSAVFRFIHRRCSDTELAADLAQQTFLKALLALPRYQPRGLPFRAWLFRIALNELKMHWRKRKELVMDLSWAEVQPLAEECGVTLQEEEARAIAAGLEHLSTDQARLIELRYFDGLSFLELGQVLGIGEDAAKMRTHRALDRLRGYLANRP